MDFIGWIFNAVKCDRINAVLVDFLNRICLNIPFVWRLSFSPLHLSLTSSGFRLLFFVVVVELNLKKSAQDQVLAGGAGKISSADKASAWVMSFEVAFAIICGFTEKE